MFQINERCDIFSLIINYDEMKLLSFRNHIRKSDIAYEYFFLVERLRYSKERNSINNSKQLIELHSN